MRIGDTVTTKEYSAEMKITDIDDSECIFGSFNAKITCEWWALGGTKKKKVFIENDLIKARR